MSPGPVGWREGEPEEINRDRICEFFKLANWSYKGLVINYGEGGGATKWLNRGPETFCAPPQDRVKPFMTPLLKSGNFSRGPLQYG